MKLKVMTTIFALALVLVAGFEFPSLSTGIASVSASSDRRAKDPPGEPTATLLVTGLEELPGSAIGPGGASFVTAPLTSRDKSVFVSGNSTFSERCQSGDYAILLTGDLEGCLSTFIQDSKCKALEDYDLYLEEGREVFVGKFRGKQGRFRTTYTFDAAYEKGFCDSFESRLEVGGGCNHKINGGSGVFKDAEGLIKFIDVIAGVRGGPRGEFHAGTGGNNFLYYGRIDFDQDD